MQQQQQHYLILYNDTKQKKQNKTFNRNLFFFNIKYFETIQF